MLTQYFQRNGIIVVPNVTWTNEESLAWTLEGMPKNSVVALSTNGCLNKETKNEFIKCYTKAMETLKPKKVIIIGELPRELGEDKRIIKFNSHLEKLHKIKKDGTI